MDKSITMYSPKVTVLMSVYNGERYLRAAMEGILNQTFKNFEFLIINDGSTDRTEEILNSYNDKRIRIFNQSNQGLTKALNRGIKLSKGEYIARQDADDISLPERLAKQVEFLDIHKNIAVLGTFAKVIDEAGCFTGEVLELPVEPKEIERKLYLGNYVAHPTVMYRNSVIKKLGGYDENFEASEDYVLWLRVIGEGYNIGCLPDFFCLYRRHNFQRSILFLERQKENGLKLRKLAIGRKLGKTRDRESKTWLLYALGVLYHEQKRHREAIEELDKALSLDPKDNSLRSDILFHKGIIYFDQQKYDQAIKLLEESLESGFNEIAAHYTLGSCYQGKNEWSKATEKFKEVLSFENERKDIYHAGAYFHLGKIYQTQGRPKEAKQGFEECLKLNPKHKKAMKNLQNLLGELGWNTDEQERKNT